MKTCLLVSDDPDDQFQFAEALHEILPGCAMLTMLNSRKALDLVQQKKLIPDFIFLDLTMSETAFVEFASLTASPDGLSKIKLVPYGDDGDIGFKKILKGSKLDKDFTYTQLKTFLKESVG